jgi:hypothetical protein
LQGVWVLNHDLSDKPGDRGGDDQGGRNGKGEEGGRRRGVGGGFGRGGFGGGGFGRGGGSGEAQEALARQRDAMRDVLTPPERLTIVQTDSTIIITAGDGRTTRLSPTGKGIKEENTGIERKTSWQAERLVSEVSGAAPGKITETYSVDADRHQLHISIALPKRGDQVPPPNSRVYDASEP